MKKWIFLFLLLPFCVRAQNIVTFAGTGSTSYSGNGVPATAAGLPDPIGGAFDNMGNYYFADGINSYRIRKVTIAGIISTIAGNGMGGTGSDGIPATTSALNFPGAVRLDTSGNLYIVDGGSNRIRKVNVTTGIITTIAGTGTGAYNGDGIPASIADLYNPLDACLDKKGNLYIADTWNNRIRKVDPTGIITTFAGGSTTGLGDFGPATAAQLITPTGLAVDDTGNIYIADMTNSVLSNRVRKVDTFGIISTVAGNGSYTYSGDGIPAISAAISPAKVAIDAAGQLYIADQYNKRVFKVDNAGIIHLVAGTGGSGFIGDGGPATAATLDYPAGVSFDPCGNLYIPEPTNRRVRKVFLNTTGMAGVTISASPSDTICKRDSVTINATVIAGSAISYHWYVNGTFTGATTSAYTYSPANGDSIRCVLVGVSQCSGNTDTVSSNTIHMTVLNTIAPTISLAGITSAPAGALVTLTATVNNAGGAYSIKWFNNGVLFNTTSTLTVTYTKGTGTDSIAARVIPIPVSTPPACYDSTTSLAHIVTVTPAGVSLLVSRGQIIIYPNPTNDVLHIDGVTTLTQYSLLSIMGAVIKQGDLQKGSNNISLQSLPAGVYVLVVTGDDGEKMIRRVVKE